MKITKTHKSNEEVEKTCWESDQGGGCVAHTEPQRAFGELLVTFLRGQITHVSQRFTAQSNTVIYV